jgi:hypothetical protein
MEEATYSITVWIVYFLLSIIAALRSSSASRRMIGAYEMLTSDS